MTLKRLILIKIIFLVIVSCGNSTDSIKVTPSVEKQTKILTIKSNFTKEEIAVFTISAIMNQPPSIIEVKKNGINFNLSYERPSDGKRFDYKVKFEGNNKVIWGNKGGRWRDTKLDEKVSFIEQEGLIIIIQTFSDGSTIKKEFKKKN